MSNLFATNMTDEDNPLSPIDAFVRERVPDYHAQYLEASGEETEEIVEKAVKGPLALRILSLVFLFACYICVRVFFSLTGEADVPAAVTWGLLAIGVAFFGVFVLLGMTLHRRAKKLLESDEVTQLTQDLDQLTDGSKQLLGVPSDVAELDVLGYGYEIKRGKEKRLLKELGDYMASSLNVFVEDGELMLANDFEKYAIPLSAITGVRVTRKKTKVFCWTKDDAPKSATYKPYRIGYDEDNDIFTARAIYSLDIAYNGETFELVVPDYDWELVLQPLLAAHIAVQPVEV